jgi:hypothetical protein
MNIYLSASYLIKEKRSIVLKSKIDAFYALPFIIRKRKKVQELCTVSFWDIHRVLVKELFEPRWNSQKRIK